MQPITNYKYYLHSFGLHVPETSHLTPAVEEYVGVNMYVAPTPVVLPSTAGIACAVITPASLAVRNARYFPAAGVVLLLVPIAAGTPLVPAAQPTMGSTPPSVAQISIAVFIAWVP